MSNLIRMTETISVPSMYCSTLDDVPQTLKESYNKFTKNKLTESNEAVNKNALLEEVKKLQERAVGSQTKDVLSKVFDKLSEAGITSRPKIWKFPVARINDSLHPNGNGRVYTRQLWENVIANQRDIICGGVGLADHPHNDADPGEFKNTSIVWLDMMIDDAQKLIYALGSFVGQYGHLAQEILEAGGRIGFSSSGFGELMLDGKTVNPETYQLERVADVVLNPSQSVYGDITNEQPVGNIEYAKQTAITESIIDIPNNRVQESKSQIKKENQMKIDATDNIENTNTPLSEDEQKREKIRNMLSEAEVKAFKKYVNQFLEDANSIKNPIERLNELNNILELVESGEITDLQEKIEDQLIAERNRLNEMVSQAVVINDEFETDALTLAENAKKIAAKAALLEDEKTELVKRNELLEQNAIDYDAVVNALTEKVQSLSKENDENASLLKEAKLENNKLTVSLSATAEKVEELTKSLNESKEKVEALEKESNLVIKEYEEKINAFKKESLKEALRVKKAESTAIKSKEAENEKLKEKVNSLVQKLYSHNRNDNQEIQSLKETIRELEKSNMYLEDKNSSLHEKILQTKKIVREELEAENKKNAESIERVTNKYNVAIGKINALMNENKKLKTDLEDLNNKLVALKEESKPAEGAKVQPATQTPVKEATEVIKHRVKEENVQPKAKTSSQYAGFNFRENKGVEIEAYWQDLLSRYGESILPYESKIRGAKTLREATSNFYMYMTEIDSDASNADKALIQEGILNASQRHQLLKEAGYDDSVKETDSDANERFKKMMPAGWK